MVRVRKAVVMLSSAVVTSSDILDRLLPRDFRPAANYREIAPRGHTSDQAVD
jgi:hypothetical protein